MAPASSANGCCTAWSGTDTHFLGIIVQKLSWAVKCATPAATNVAPSSGHVARLNAMKPGAASAMAGPTSVHDAHVPRPSAAKMEATPAA